MTVTSPHLLIHHARWQTSPADCVTWNGQAASSRQRTRTMGYVYICIYI